MKLNYRCSNSKCRVRQVKHKPLDSYLPRNRVCSVCRSKLSLDYYRQSKEGKRGPVCRCGNVTTAQGKPFPHRAGSSVWCSQSNKPPTDDDIMGRFGTT